MVSSIVEATLYILVTALYVIAEKKELLQPVLIRCNPRAVRRPLVKR